MLILSPGSEALVGTAERPPEEVRGASCSRPMQGRINDVDRTPHAARSLAAGRERFECARARDLNQPCWRNHWAVPDNLHPRAVRTGLEGLRFVQLVPVINGVMGWSRLVHLGGLVSGRLYAGGAAGVVSGLEYQPADRRPLDQGVSTISNMRSIVRGVPVPAGSSKRAHKTALDPSRYRVPLDCCRRDRPSHLCQEAPEGLPPVTGRFTRTDPCVPTLRTSHRGAPGRRPRNAGGYRRSELPALRTLRIQFTQLSGGPTP